MLGSGEEVLFCIHKWVKDNDAAKPPAVPGEAPAGVRSAEAEEP